MPRTEAQKEWTRKQRKAGKQGYIRIDMKIETVDNWKAYAQSQGKPLATLIRGLMAADMATHGWIMDNQKPEDVQNGK